MKIRFHNNDDTVPTWLLFNNKILLLQAERLADYSRLLGGSQPALVDGRRKDLNRIQDLFPQDYLGLHEADAVAIQSPVSIIDFLYLYYPSTWRIQREK